ncbi:MAG: hypothetical protein ACLPQS_03995 [Acidimicrobiales bacterium]
MSLSEARSVAPGVRWAASRFFGDGYYVLVADLSGDFPTAPPPGKERLFEASVQGTGTGGGLEAGITEFGTPRSWAPVARLLQGQSAHVWWLPVVAPKTLPSFVTSFVFGNLKIAPHQTTASWIVTTAGRIDSFAPFQSAVPQSAQAPALVWVVQVYFSGKDNHGPTDYLVTRRIGSTQTYESAGIATPTGTLPLGRFGTVHTISLPKS